MATRSFNTTALRTPVKTYAGATFVYLLAWAVCWVVLRALPGAPLWTRIDVTLIEGTPITAFGVLHLIIGFPLYLYGALNVWHVVETFRSVQDANGQPRRLLTDGYYAEVRHPFYALNMVQIAAISFAVCSTYAAALGLLGIALFFLNGFVDERGLYGMFGSQYEAYTRRVPRRYFTNATGLYMLLLAVLTVLGMVL